MVGAHGWEEGEIPGCCSVETVSIWEGGKVLEMEGGDALHRNVLNTIQMYAEWLEWQVSCYVYFTTIKNKCYRTCLVDQWLRLCAPNAGGPGSVPAQGTGPHTPQRETEDPACRN